MAERIQDTARNYEAIFRIEDATSAVEMSATARSKFHNVFGCCLLGPH
jgi:hypothetical protein